MQRAALRQEKLNYLSKSLISPLGHQCAASDTPIQCANELWMNWAYVPRKKKKRESIKEAFQEKKNKTHTHTSMIVMGCFTNW